MQYFVKRGEQVQGPYSREQLLEHVNANQFTGTDQVATSSQGPFQELNIVWPFISGESPVEPPPVQQSPKQPSGYAANNQTTGNNKTIVLVCAIAGLSLIGILAAFLLKNRFGNQRANVPIEQAIDGEWVMKLDGGLKGTATLRLVGDKIEISKMGGGDVMHKIVESNSNVDVSEVRNQFPGGTFADWSKTVSWIKLREAKLKSEILFVFDESRTMARLRVRSHLGPGNSFVGYGSMSLVKSSKFSTSNRLEREEAEKEFKQLEEAVRKEESIQASIIAEAVKERRMPKEADKISINIGDGKKMEVSYGTKDFRPSEEIEIPYAAELPNEGVSAELISKMKKSRETVREHEKRMQELDRQFLFSSSF